MKKQCTKCKEIKHSSEFFKKNSTCSGLDFWCKQCNIEYHKLHRKPKVERHPIIDGKKQCIKCGEFKLLSVFKTTSHGKYITNICKGCSKLDARNRHKINYIKKPKKEKVKIVIFEKKCTTCGIIKPIQDFCVKSNNSDGRNIYCRECSKITKREYENNNKEVRELYYKNNKHKGYEKRKNWYNKNRDKINEKQKNRLVTDINFKIKKLLRGRIYVVIKHRYKSDSAVNLVGCSIPFLIKHLESKFTKGMTWENHGKRGWHIDHIIPCAKFDLTDIEQQKQCFHYSNLQPLWAIDNSIKSDKLTKPQLKLLL